VRAYVCVCIYIYMCVCVCAFVRSCVRVCVCAGRPDFYVDVVSKLCQGDGCLRQGLYGDMIERQETLC
jgi:hypothetical protein